MACCRGDWGDPCFWDATADIAVVTVVVAVVVLSVAGILADAVGSSGLLLSPAVCGDAGGCGCWGDTTGCCDRGDATAAGWLPIGVR